MKIPKSFKEILVREYIKLRPILEKEYDNPFSKIIDILSVFNERTEVLGKTIKEINLIAEGFNFMYAEPSKKLEQYFEINGSRYGIVNHVSDLNAGQYISVVSLLKDLADRPNLSYEIIHEILACVVFPVDKKRKVLNIEPSYYRKVSEDIYNHMSINDAYPIAVFFCNLSESLTSLMQDYSIGKAENNLTEAKEIQLEVAKDFMSDGDGSLHSITSAMETLQSDHTTKI